MRSNLRVFVLTWKPEVNEDFGEAEFNTLATTCWKQGYVDTKWRFSTRRYEVGDHVVVIRQGRKPGLVAFGAVTAKDESIDKAGSHYTAVRLKRMRDTLEHPFLPKKELLLIGIRMSLLQTQTSGQSELNQDEIQKLEQYIATHLGGDLSSQCL